jgi:endonuclease G
MAKFRRSHSGEPRRGKKPNLMGRSIILILFLGGFLLAIIVFANKSYFGKHKTSGSVDEIFNIDYRFSEAKAEDRFFIPVSATGIIVHHKYYSLSYNEKYEQADWVAYVLTKSDLAKENVKRSDWFDPDVKVKTRSAIYHDYSSSRYSRGHLVPVADMAFSEGAMKESFLMSNISPQVKGFNNGIWNELENLVRDWAWKNQELIIVTGPVLKNIDKFIGKNEVGVPKMFYKIILDIKESERKALAFLIPNEISEKPLSEYIVTIDSLEALTGIDFFGNLMTVEEQNNIESKIIKNKWEFNPEIFKKRIEIWNKQ